MDKGYHLFPEEDQFEVGFWIPKRDKQWLRSHPEYKPNHGRGRVLGVENWVNPPVPIIEVIEQAEGRLVTSGSVFPSLLKDEDRKRVESLLDGFEAGETVVGLYTSRIGDGSPLVIHIG